MPLRIQLEGTIATVIRPEPQPEVPLIITPPAGLTRGKKKKEKEPVMLPDKKIARNQINEQAKQRAMRAKELEQKKFKTRNVNLQQLTSVKLDNRTFVFVKPGSDIRQIKHFYQQLKLKRNGKDQDHQD